MKTRRTAAKQSKSRALVRRQEHGVFVVYVGFLRAKHSARLTPLQRCVFLWLCSERGPDGWVCGGAPVPACIIARDLGCAVEHVRVARETLARFKYIRLRATKQRGAAPAIRVLMPPRLRSLADSEAGDVAETPHETSTLTDSTTKCRAIDSTTNCRAKKGAPMHDRQTKDRAIPDRSTGTVLGTAVLDLSADSDLSTTALNSLDSDAAFLTHPTPTQRPPRKQSSNVTRLRDRFAALHAKTLDAPYHAEPARDGRLFKRLLTTYSNPAYVEELLDCFWQQVESARAGDPNAWIGKAAPSVPGFYKQIPNILKRYQMETAPSLDARASKGESA